MVFEIRNAGFINRGAFLMLRSIMAECRERRPGCIITMVPSGPEGHQPFQLLVGAGLFPRFGIDRVGGSLNGLGDFIPRRLRRRYGLILESEVDVVFDAAGFAYGDPWPESNLRNLASAAQRAVDRGATFFLLPQSFGEFSSKKSRSLIKTVAKSATWMFARDKTSLNNLREILVDHVRMSLAPDFTSLLPGATPKDPERFRNTVAIIPNVKMLQRTDRVTQMNYLPILASAISLIRRAELDPLIVIHEGSDDRELSDKLRHLLPDIPVIDESDPIVIKGILGSCLGSIGSRYHGLVSCLSQGVPCLATGWSAKYESLLSAYGISDALLDLRQPENVERRINRWLVNELTSPDLRTSLSSFAHAERSLSRAMWEQIFAGGHGSIGQG